MWLFIQPLVTESLNCSFPTQRGQPGTSGSGLSPLSVHPPGRLERERWSQIASWQGLAVGYRGRRNLKLLLLRIQALEGSLSPRTLQGHSLYYSLSQSHCLLSTFTVANPNHTLLVVKVGYDYGGLGQYIALGATPAVRNSTMNQSRFSIISFSFRLFVFCLLVCFCFVGRSVEHTTNTG